MAKSWTRHSYVDLRKSSGKVLFFVVATFYLEIVTFITQNFDLVARNIEL